MEEIRNKINGDFVLHHAASARSGGAARTAGGGRALIERTLVETWRQVAVLARPRDRFRTTLL